MKKHTYLLIPVELNGNQIKLQIDTEYFRKLYEEAKENNQEEFTIHFEYDNTPVDVRIDLANAIKMIRKYEKYTDFVPRRFNSYIGDLTKKLLSKSVDPIVGRDNEIEKVWFYLSQKTRNNVSIIGDIEVGKTAIAKEIARQILDSECPKEFYNRRVLTLRPNKLLEIENDKKLKAIIDKLIKFLAENKKNIILYIDDAIAMKTDEYLIIMLYSIIKNNIPLIMTLSTEYYEDYFLQDTNITKYMNEVYVEEPELNEVQPMVENHIERLKERYKINISDEMIKFGIYTSVLSNSVSCNPGNAINVFNKAFLEAKRKGIDHVGKHSILSCYDTYLKQYNAMTEKQKRATAYHETGHYISHIMCEHATDIKIAFVSILPMMSFLGVNWLYEKLGEETQPTRDYYIDYITTSLAGRIAERIITNADTSGACSDLEHANYVARAMIMNYGLSSDEDMKMRFYNHNEMSFLTDKTKEDIEAEMKKIVDEGYKRAVNIIENNKELLTIIAERLLEEEILTGEQLEEICKEYKNSK